jgi:arginase family enzyme
MTEVTGFVGPETFMGLPAGLPQPGCRAAILGVPFDCGTHPFRVGARQGPLEVRRESRLIRRYHPSLADVDVLSLLGAARIVDTGAVPIGIGGDGSVSLPLMRAAARRHRGLVALHIDSHTDAYPYTPDDRYNAATQFTNAAEESLVDASSSWHIGVRGFTYCSGVLEHTRGLGFRVITIEDLVRRGFAQTIAEFSDTVAGRPVYLCWDMDVFDPSVAPGVCTPAWGGLSAREGIELLRSLSGLNIVAMDFNTVSPPQDVNGMAAQLCSHMIMEALVLLAANLGLLPE